MGNVWPAVQTVLGITGFADVLDLQRAVDTVCRAHPHLLRGFGRDPRGRLIPIERRDTTPRLRTVDLRGHPAGQREAVAQRLEEHERREEFALSAPPLIRLLLIRTGDRERRLVVTSHRLVLDDWSHAALVHAVLAAFSTGSGAGIADRGEGRQCTFDRHRSDERLRTLINGPGLRSETYAGCEFDLAAASGAENPTRLSRALPQDVIKRIDVRAADRGFHPEAVVHGAWAFALSGLTGHPEVVFAAAVASARTASSDGPGPIDMAHTLLPMTVRVGAARTPVDLLRAISLHAPGDMIGPHHDTAADVPFDTAAALAPEPIGPVTPRLGIRISTLSTFDAKPFPLSFSIVPGPSWIARLDFQPAALPTRVAEAVFADATAFLRAIAYAPDRPLSRIDGRTAVEVRSARAA